MYDARIVALPAFQDLLFQKRRFLVSLVLFFVIFYLVLPILAAYSTVLQNHAFSGVTWAWIYALAQFVMTWAVCVLYSHKAKKFDAMVCLLKANT